MQSNSTLISGCKHYTLLFTPRASCQGKAAARQKGALFNEQKQN